MMRLPCSKEDVILAVSQVVTLTEDEQNQIWSNLAKRLAYVRWKRIKSMNPYNDNNSLTLQAFMVLEESMLDKEWDEALNYGSNSNV